MKIQTLSTFKVLYISFSNAFGERNSVDFHQLWPVWNLWWLSSSADRFDNISVHATVRQTQVPRMENTKNAQGQCDTKLGYETINGCTYRISEQRLRKCAF